MDILFEKKWIFNVVRNNIFEVNHTWDWFFLRISIDFMNTFDFMINLNFMITFDFVLNYEGKSSQNFALFQTIKVKENSFRNILFFYFL